MSSLAFELPKALEAHDPPEARGQARDQVRLLVAERAGGRIRHVSFRDLPDLLAPGDLLVVNTSATLPAAVDARRADGSRLRLHFATRAPGLDDSWRVVELRSEDGGSPARGRAGDRLALADDGGEVELVAPYVSSARLMLARYHGQSTVEDYLERHGRPIRYGYLSGNWPLETYQNVYATVPGSAEMPSAGRPFSAELIACLAARGILLAPITLHCGVSSLERHEPPFPEQYDVPETTARLVAATRRWGGRVIAVGTTVVRALETVAVAEPGGETAAGAETAGRRGWTNLVIGPEHRLRAVDGLITGWHEPEASHLQMLEAVAGTELLARSYREALARDYLWHEFGDSHLILP
jgi:S-adenosylmethionine:tRNA ribosyltransferase-isomerase